MSLPGTKVPPSKFPKDGTCTKLHEVSGAKSIKEDKLMMGQASDVGVAPPSRVYTRDYSKVGRAPGDKDDITAALGNPLGW